MKNYKKNKMNQNKLLFNSNKNSCKKKNKYNKLLIKINYKKKILKILKNSY